MKIRLFMWGYQHYFQVHAEYFAEKIFNKIDKNLKPNVILIGVQCEYEADSYPVCLQPEDDRYDPELFLDVLEKAKDLEALDERSKIWYGDDDAYKEVKRNIKSDSIKNAIQEIIRELDEDYGVKSFCSSTRLVNGYMVSIVLQLDAKSFKSHYSLASGRRGRNHISRSILESVINEYFNECVKELEGPEPGNSIRGFERDPEELIRAAGKYLMYTPASVGDMMGLHGLFEACNIISSLRYEGEEVNGKLLISRQEHPDIKMNIQFISPIKLRDFGAVRKLLEISSEDVCLLSDSHVIYGLGTLSDSYDHRKEDVFMIQFTRHYQWDLMHAGNLLMKVSYGLPYLPNAKIDEDKFRGDIKRIFKDKIDSNSIKNLMSLIKESIKQKHGTIVVISGGVEEEVKRLKSQAIPIDPVELSSSLIKLITSIDGAILIDQDGICHAIGVILDGLASKNGKPSRGARYNSAIRYVEYTDHPCMAVVISEDGLIDLVPDLMPQINRSAIESAISTLHNLSDAEEDTGKFHEVMSWLDKHRFYLSPEVCEEINKIKENFEQMMQDKGITHLKHQDFQPHEEMNDSYFFDEE